MKLKILVDIIELDSDKQDSEYLFKNIMTLPDSYVDPPFNKLLRNL